MAWRVFLKAPRRCVERPMAGQHLTWCVLQLRAWRRQTASLSTENEWTLDLEADPDELDHAPQDEPRPPSQTQASSSRLLFNVGKKLMTADECTRKARAVCERSAITLDRHHLGASSEDGEEEEVGGVRSEGVTRGGGLQSMRQTKKFLRGRAMSGSRLTTPPSETTAMLTLLKEQLNMTAGHLEIFSTVPSVLGSEVSEVGDRVRELRRIGFTKREVETLLVSFPAILDLDYQNVYEVCEVLKGCIPGGYMLRGLLARHPFLFLQPVKQVEERVMALKKICQDPNALGFLLHRFPLLLSAPLTPSTLHTITKYTTSHYTGEALGHSWVAKSLYHNLSTLPARLEPGPDVAALVELMVEFQLEPTTTFVNFPGFFKATYTHVTSLLNVLTGSPLYLDSGLVRTLLCSIPDQLVWTEDAAQLQSHLELLCSFFTSPKECVDKISSYPGLVLPAVGLRSWQDSLASHGFSSQETAEIMSGTPNVLLQNREGEFLPRLRLLLSVTEKNPSVLVSCPVGARVRMFNTPVEVLRERLNYVEKHKPDMVCGQHLEKIFASRDREFALFCGRTVELVHSDTGLCGIELRRFKRSSSTIRERTATSQQLGKSLQPNLTNSHAPTLRRTLHVKDNKKVRVPATSKAPVVKRATDSVKTGVSLPKKVGKGKTQGRKIDQKPSKIVKGTRKRIAEREREKESTQEAVLQVSVAGVFPEAPTTTSATKLLYKQKTADTTTTTPAVTTPGKGSYARKERPRTGQTRFTN